MTKTAVPKSWNWPVGAIGTGNTYNSWQLNGIVSTDFQLPAVNAIASLGIILSFVNCHSSTNAADTTNCAISAPHRNAYTGESWDYQVGVHGGKWPYKYDLIQAPAGMTIGETLTVSSDVLVAGDTYGRMTWTNPTVGEHTIHVRVTDQLGAIINSTWTMVVGTANWIIVDPVSGNDSTGDGSIGLPYKSFSNLATGHTDKLALVLAGTVTISSSNFVMTTGAVNAIIGRVGDVVNIAQTNAWMTVNNFDDATIKGVTLFHLNMTAATQDRKCIAQLGQSDRTNILDIKITAYEYGANGAANGAMFYSSGARDEDCFLYNWEITGEAGTVMNTFQQRNCLIEKINIHDANLDNTDGSSDTGVIKLKDGWANQTIRLCECWDNNTWNGNRSFINVAGQDQNSLGIFNTDVCYNTGYRPSGDVFYAWFFGQTNGTESDCHVYRNSFASDVGENCYKIGAGQDTIDNERDENNIFENGTESTNSTVTNVDNQDGAVDYLDASLNLQGAHRTNFLGTHGAEVSG